MIHFQTKRLNIRDPNINDLAEYHRLLSDNLTSYYWLHTSSNTIDQSRHNLEEAIAEAHNPHRTKYFFSIEHKEQYIGTVGYTVTQTTPIGKIAGAGYAILPEHREQGYATEAFHALIRFAFENGVYRLTAGCRSENKASERVLQKCGLVKEAEFKHHTWHDGQLKDRVEYRLLKDEYMQIKTHIRPVQLSDAARVAEIHVFAWRSAYRGIVPDNHLFNTLQVSKRITRFEDAVRNKTEEIYVFDDGIIRAFISVGLCRDEDKPAAFELGAIYVDSLMQRQGIGTKMMQFFENLAMQRGFNEACLRTFEKNLAAQALYEKFGYTRDGARKLHGTYNAAVVRYAKTL